MADVSHELGSLRFVVESPLSSKVAMFNNQAQQHQQAQSLNPFTQTDGGRVSPKPSFSKDQYGKPLAGSLTEMRGQKANMHVMKEMIELCQIIDSEGYPVNDEPTMRVIPFGELFNIYNFISDKVVGILLRARKYKLVEFEGEMLFQRRDDDVPIYLLKPIAEIRRELETKIDDIKRGSSPAPQATTVLLDRSAHMQKLQDSGLSVSSAGSRSKSKSRSPTPSRAPTPTPSASLPVVDVTAPPSVSIVADAQLLAAALTETAQSMPEVIAPVEQPVVVQPQVLTAVPSEALDASSASAVTLTAAEVTSLQPAQAKEQSPGTLEPTSGIDDSSKTDMNNNSNNSNNNIVTNGVLPTIVVDVSAVHDRSTADEETVNETQSAEPIVATASAVDNNQNGAAN